ncbi:hypothetical protein PWY87_33225 [Kribbella solani]|uniref:hypothetical protein n=1 Tax=Kribbella solani TaxID=236067 RepID=UPI0029AB61AD|nr:hypothetical protein [Kribbella solani]MDX3006584.1 hypothetical protein [Kribbella solani]
MDRHLSISEYFTQRFGVPAYVENDVNVLAVAEGTSGGSGPKPLAVAAGLACGEPSRIDETKPFL